MNSFKSSSKIWLITGLIMVLLAACISGCGNQNADTPKEPELQDSAEPVTLLVSAAASLTEAMGDIEKLYKEDHPNVSFTFNLASSGKLQQQIEQGAPADIFISAAKGKMDALQEKDLIVSETRKDIVKNTLVLIVDKNNEDIKGFNDLENARTIAIGEPESVPAGKYASEALTNMNLFDKLQSKLVYDKDVRQVLAHVESGDADAGLLYQTDANISDKVKVVEVAAENTHSPLVYPVAVVKDSKNLEDARAFADFLSTDKAAAVFEKYGFSTIKK
jgi:molybdate transport system substrate-binding protein